MADYRSSIWYREAERRSNDLIRVYNPTEKDYVVEYDRANGTKLFRVPKKEETVLVRYIAEKYIKEMYQKLVTEKADNALLEENEKRVAKGMAELRKYDEQYRYEAPLYNLSEDEAKKLISLLYVGVEREFGIDQAYEEESQVYEKPVFDRALESVKSDKPASLASPVTAKNDPTGDEGIPTAKTEGFVCDHPGCSFTAKNKLGLFSHKRTHR